MGVGCALVMWSVFTVTTVNDRGMEPAIEVGSKVIINRLAYGDKEVQVGDVVAIRNIVHGQDGEGSILVRRVAAVGGDRVRIDGNTLYINGDGYYDYMKEAVDMDDMEEISLGDGQLFLMADNRKAALDSRNKAIGVVDVEECIGKVCIID
jgi:signal peptidase I